MRAARKNVVGAVSPRGRGAQRDEHVHVGAAVHQGQKRAFIKAPADEKLHRRGNDQLPPARMQQMGDMGMGSGEHQHHHQQKWKREDPGNDDHDR